MKIKYKPVPQAKVSIQYKQNDLQDELRVQVEDKSKTLSLKVDDYKRELLQWACQYINKTIKELQ